MLRKTFAALGALALTTSANAEPLAVCGGVSGRAFFVENGFISNADAGWREDRITSGRITLSRNDKGEFDVIYLDATGAVFSSVGEGAKVLATRISSDDAAILVVYPGATVEIYHFVRDAAGTQRVMLLQSKGSGPITKAGVMVGECSFMKLQ